MTIYIDPIILAVLVALFILAILASAALGLLEWRRRRALRREVGQRLNNLRDGKL